MTIHIPSHRLAIGGTESKEGVKSQKIDVAVITLLIGLFDLRLGLFQVISVESFNIILPQFVGS
ncbi:hypothetical protein KOR42_05500 [Thalassoglobus neptunius]|uniref:Uncharacterized protein n=1 Tax=Thalassoglobus neptunius TaxID=1938619 RepID=A0A5C5X599_9PLAN|nr:hypothetical protein KOR42_05500 [Thalassoglobus neptunius]